MPIRLTGLPSLSYQGVEAPQPPNITTNRRAPTTNDYLQYNIGDLWLNIAGLFAVPPVAATSADIWMLVSKNKRIANGTWVNLGNGPSSVIGLRADDLLIASALAGIINVFSAATAGNAVDNLTTDAATANTVTVRLRNSITLPTSTSNASGVIFLDGLGASRFISNAGGTNTFIGQNSGNYTLSGSSNFGGGVAAAQALTSGANNVLIGNSAGVAITTGSNNLALSGNALQQLVTGSSNVSIGQGSGFNYTGAESNNINIGSSAGLVGELGVIRIVNSGSNNTNNVFIGQQAGNAGYTLATAVSNTFVGTGVGRLITVATGNSGYGTNSLAALTSGIQNSAYGSQSLGVLTTGTSNTGIGYLTGGITTGSKNIFIGQSSGGALAAAESDNVFLDNVGIIGDNKTIRIGRQEIDATKQTKCFIAGIRGITTLINDAVPVLIDSSGQLGVTSSSARYKNNINDMGPRSDDIMKLRPRTFNYINDSSEFEQFGLIAEEVHEIFPRLVVYDNLNRPETVRYNDLVPLMLNEIQKLSKRVEELEKKLK